MRHKSQGIAYHSNVKMPNERYLDLCIIPILAAQIRSINNSTTSGALKEPSSPKLFWYITTVLTAFSAECLQVYSDEVLVIFNKVDPDAVDVAAFPYAMHNS